MGFNQLRIVGIPPEEKNSAHKTAYQAHDLLDSISYYEDLSLATADMDLIVGTTSKSRKNRTQLLPSRELNRFLSDRKDLINNVAIVFGNETNGLSTEDERQCQILSTILMASDYPSINLSHSVMIYAYELCNIQNTIQTTQSNHSITFRVFDEKIKSFLQHTAIDQRQPELYQRILDRCRKLAASDINLVMSLLRYLRNQTKN